MNGNWLCEPSADSDTTELLLATIRKSSGVAILVFRLGLSRSAIAVIVSPVTLVTSSAVAESTLGRLRQSVARHQPYLIGEKALARC
jgi:hypothetical protein